MSAEQPPEATQQQLQAIAADLHAVRGITEYGAILAAVSQILGREIGRPDELSEAEAEQVIAALRGVAQAEREAAS